MIVVQCPACGAFETLDTSDKGLIPTKKYRQQGKIILHDCGSDRPCKVLWQYENVEAQNGETED